ncbi:energy transducer TonB [Qipengyuania sp. JC766]|uniref:energy transducer TonB n=1 Tax=Qipengyuania sp. JC766 TaxID=3232139 RepID=UPI003458686F
MIIVGLIHVGIGFLLVTGLAQSAFEKVQETVTTVDIEEEPEEPEPEETPPPPPPDEPQSVEQPVVIPPQPNRLSEAPPPRDFTPDPPDFSNFDPNPRDEPTSKTCLNGRVVPIGQACPPPPPATKTCPNGQTVPVSATCPPPPPPAAPPKPPTPSNGGWVRDSDYRSSWINRDYEGTVSFRVNVGSNGRVTSCSVTGGSAPSTLKDATCSLVQSRARFNAATDSSGNRTDGTFSGTVQWQIPQ